jgi:uncharacterized membrane protein
MLGILIGTACLIGLIRMMRGPRVGFGRGRRFLVGRLSARLAATPDQERTLRQAAAEIEGALSTLRREPRQFGADLAKAVRGEIFDEGALSSAFDRHDEELRALRLAAAGALARVHTVLDPKQRDELARVVGGVAPPPAPAGDDPEIQTA